MLRLLPVQCLLLSLPLTSGEECVDNSEGLCGHSLVPALQGKPAKRAVYSETDYRAYTYKRCIITPDDWKLVYTLESQTRELYHLATDPREQKDVAATNRTKADELQKKLFAHFKSIGQDLTAKRWKTGLNPVYRSQGQ